MNFKQKILIVVSAGLVTLAADQATKVWARGALLGPGEVEITQDSGKKAVISVVGGQPGIEFRLSFNKGSAFGMFSGTGGARIFLSVIGLFALGLIFYLLKRPESDSRLFVWALGFVAGGAVGNLVDRIAFGQVTDFIWVWLTPSIKIVWPWPAFNIADIGLVVGVGLMIPAMLFAKVPEEDGGASKRGAGDQGTEASAGAKDAKAEGEEEDGKGQGAKGQGAKGQGAKAKGGKAKGGKAKGGKK